MSNSTDIEMMALRLNRERVGNLKRGAPAIALVSVAILLLTYCAMLARPRIQDRYRQESEKVMGQLGLTPTAAIGAGELVIEASLEEQRAELNLANLYLKRLIAIEPNDELARWRSGIVAEASSAVYERTSMDVRRSGDTKKAESLRSQGVAELKRAKEIMETLSQSKGTEAIRAQLWLLSQDLQTTDLDAAQLERLATTTAGILVSSPDERGAIRCLGQVRLRQAYSMEWDIGHEKRESYIHEAIELLSKLESPVFIEQAYLAEAMDASRIDESIQTAIRATQAFWTSSSSAKQSPEYLSAMFSCLLRLGNVQEGQSLILESIPTLRPDQQIRLRELCADLCLRSIVCQYEFPSSLRRKPDAGSLSLALRLNAGTPKLTRLLTRLVQEQDSDSMARSINQNLVDAGNLEPTHLIAAIRAALKDDWPTSRKELQLSVQNDSSFAPIGALFVSSLVDDGLASVPFGMRFLEQLARVSPDSSNLWLTRAYFCEKNGELEKAAECLEPIIEEARKNPKILDFLESLYTRMNKMDDVVRIQGRKVEFRKPNP